MYQCLCRVISCSNVSLGIQMLLLARLASQMLLEPHTLSDSSRVGYLYADILKSDKWQTKGYSKTSLKAIISIYSDDTLTVSETGYLLWTVDCFKEVSSRVQTILKAKNKDTKENSEIRDETLESLENSLPRSSSREMNKVNRSLYCSLPGN